MKNILITGGAGYIGSHIGYLFAQNKHNVIILDTHTEHAAAIAPWATIIKGNYGNATLVNQLFSTYQIDTVIHCAGFIEVGQSVVDPLAFYQNNVANTISLLACMHAHHINKIIFSSSCAVFGIPLSLPLAEDHPQKPINPYGQTKAMIERMLHDTDDAYGIKSICLRFFNAAGAFPDAGLGERHEPETHLIPLLLRAAHNNTSFSIFGTNHATPDGTCIRDFVHVRDIASAHVCALEYLDAAHASDCFNLGTGHGYSVQEVIDAASRVCQKKIAVVHKEARPGDPAILVADPRKANRILQWHPIHSSIERMVHDANVFYKRNGGM